MMTTSVKITQGSFHQGSIEKFGLSAGTQCTCCALFSVTFSIIKNPGAWKSIDIDFVVQSGDKIYKNLNLRAGQYLMFNELPRQLSLVDFSFDIIFLDLESHLLKDFSCNSFKSDFRFDGFLLIIDGKCISVMWNKKNYFLFDSHSRDGEGRTCPDGTATLAKFSSKRDLHTYVMERFNTESDPDLVYELQYISIAKENKAAASHAYSNKTESERSHKRKSEHNTHTATSASKKKATSTNDGYKRKQKKNSLSLDRGSKRKISPVNLENNRETVLPPEGRGSGEHQYLSRILCFKKAIKEGPFYVCVVCNRCLYRKTVIKFNGSKYDASHSYLYTGVQSFDSNNYICLTCDRYLKKKEIPCQAVWNKLELNDIPDELSVLNRLERVLIAKRILFKKINIMPMGRQPKIKGSICNIPVQVNAVSNCLPRRTDEDILFVRLKRKIIFNGYLYFESVRPELIENALLNLKRINPFYSQILINLNNINEELLCLTDSDAIVCHDEFPLLRESETDQDEYLEDDNPLDQERINSDEMCVIPNIYSDDTNILDIAPGENRSPLSFFNDDFCEEQAFPHLFPKGKFGYKVERPVLLSPVKYFNQRLLNYTQRFPSDSDFIFFANYVMQQINLYNQINIATSKMKGTITASQLCNNSRETLRSFICEEKGYSFMKSVKGTPAYWKRLLYDVLAMIKQKGLPTFFLTLSCADLRWQELVDIIIKLNRLETSDEELSYFKKCELLNQNPVLTSRHFQYRVETFFKEIILHKNGPFSGKVDNYAIKVEFQARGSPHIHAFIWIKDAPILSHDTIDEYLQFVDSIVRTDCPDENSHPELFQLVKQYQTHSHSRSCRKYKNIPCRFNYGRFFTEKSICAEPLHSDIDEAEKEKILFKRSLILKKVKEFIDEFLNPHLSSFRKDLTIDQILDIIKISKIDYYNALSISPDNDFLIHLRRPPNSCFVNNYFEVGLKAWEANMDLSPVFNYFKAVSYMCSYFSKSETESSTAMKKAVEESKDLGFKDRMKKIAISFLSHRQCSVQEAVYQLLPELWLRKTFPVVDFVNTNLPDKRFRMCKSENELKDLPGDSHDVFKKNNLDRYMDRPNLTFKGGRYAVLDQFCYAQFLSYYYLDSKPSPDFENDCQPNVLNDDDLEQPVLYPKRIPLMSSEEKMCCRCVKKVLRYHSPNPLLEAESYAHHLLMLFYPFRKESELLCEEEGSYVSKLSSQNVLNVVNRNKAIFEPWGDVVDLSLRQFVSQPRTDQENSDFETNSEDEQNNDPIIDFEIETPSSGVASNSGPTISFMSEDDINVLIRTLNNRQREVFDLVNNWARKLIISYSAESPIVVEPLQIFVTGGAGTGKSHLIKTLYASLNKTLNYKSNSLNKPKTLLLAPTGVAAVNIAGNTVHSALGIPIDCRGLQIPKLSNKRKCALRLQLEELKVIIIDEISMVSNKLLLHIHQRLLDIFGYSNNYEKPFAGVTMIVVGDLYQLPPVMQRPVFADYFDELFNIYHLWKVFKMCELTEIMRQKGDSTLIDLLNNIRVGILTENDKVILNSRFIEKENLSYPSDALHIFAENEPARLHNLLMLEKIDGPSIILRATDQIPNGVPDHVYNKILNLKQSQTSGLAFELSVKIGAKVMLTSNIDVNDKLINGQIGTIIYLKSLNNTIKTVYIKFNDVKIGENKRLSDAIARQTDSVPINQVTFEIKTHSKKEAAPVIKRTQFPLVLSWACTVHKVQGLSLDQVVVSFDLTKQKSFNPGQVYVALSRITSLNGLFCIGTFKENSIIVDKRALSEYTRLRNTSSLLKVENLVQSDNCVLSMALCNVRSLRKHLNDIKVDKRFIQCNLIVCTETQLGSNDHFDLTLDGYSIIQNKANHKYSSIAILYNENLLVQEEFRLDGISIIKVPILGEILKVLVCYRKNDWANEEFYECLGYLSVSYQPEFIMGDFNIKPNPELSMILRDYVQIVTEATHIAGAILDHVYVQNEFSAKHKVDNCINSVFFSDHEMIKINISTLEK